MTQIHIDQSQSFSLRTIVTGFLDGAAVRAHEMIARRKIRKSLGRLSEQELRDIGLTASDIDAMTAAPLSTDAAAKLEIRARSRTGNW